MLRANSIDQAVIAACVALLLHSATVMAQSEAMVRGRVVTAAGGAALPGAAVILENVRTREARHGEGDAAGAFQFQDVPPGEYSLSVSFDGFAARTMRLMMAPREIRNVTVALDVAHVDVQVQVAADAPSLSGTQAPGATLLTLQRLESIPVSQRTSLPEAIVTAAPGMIRGHDDFVHIRGHEVALNPLINGVAFWENPHSLFSAGLSPMVIQSANVMTGAFAAEYGNRFGGVVDIVTKSGLQMDHEGSVTAAAGQARRQTAAADFGGHEGPLAYYVFGSIAGSGRVLSPPDPRAIHDDGSSGHLFAQLDSRVRGNDLLRMLVMGDGANLQIPMTPLDVELRPWAEATQRTRQQTAVIGWTHAVSRTTTAATFYQRWSRTRLLPADGPLTARADVRRDLLTVGVKGDLTRFAGRHTIKAGVDAVRLRPDEALAYDYSGYRAFTHLLDLPHIHVTGDAIEFSGRDTGGQVSGYLQDVFAIDDRLTADFGLRVDRYDLLVSATHPSPRANLALRAPGNAVLHVSFNHFFVPPPIEGVLSSAAGLTRQIADIGVALAPIRPATENQLEAGVSVPAGPLRVSATGYHRVTDNPVHTTVWPDARVYSYASFTRGRAFGMETKVDAPGLARFGITGYLNYALGRVTFSNPVTGGFITEAEHLTATDRFLAPMDQLHTLTGGATYRPAPALWVGGAVEYGSGTPRENGGGHSDETTGLVSAETNATEAGRVPSHFTATLSLGLDLLRDARRRPRLAFQIDAENSTGKVYLVAQESEFSPGQYSIPRLISFTSRIRF